MKNSPWFSPDGKVIYNLERYQKLEVVYQKPSKGYCFVVGLPFGREEQWEDIVKGEKPEIKKQWEIIKEILLS